MALFPLVRFLQFRVQNGSCGSLVRIMANGNSTTACRAFHKSARKIAVPCLVRQISLPSNFMIINRMCSSNISPIQPKKRVSRKRGQLSKDMPNQDRFLAVAYSSAEGYRMSSLAKGLKVKGLYHQLSLPDDIKDEVFHVRATYQTGAEPRHFYFFSDGTVVFWNIPMLEQRSILNFLKPYEIRPYSEALVMEETENLEYSYSNNETKLAKGSIHLKEGETNELQCYAFSNAIALSVKLAMMEATLQSFIDKSICLRDDMALGKKVNPTEEQLSKMTWELFALRDMLNLRSDLLDTPDFYWERDDLEHLYRQTYNYFDIAKRTRVMNDRLTYCMEPIEALSSRNVNRHFVKLERVIIALIAIEVVFGGFHFLDRIYSILYS